MRAVIQRVGEARVSCDGRAVAEIGRGLLIFVGVAAGDDDEDARWLASKCAVLRIFQDGEGRMNLSVRDAGGEALVVSQFTLLADCLKGRRPSFVRAAPPDVGRELYELFADLVRAEGVPVQTGEFGARMRVSIENEGPVTIILDSRERLARTSSE